MPDETPQISTEPTQTSHPVHGPDNRHHQTEVVVNRLSRIEGHVRAVKRMVEEGTPCPDVLIQIAAIRAALNSVGKVILEDHIQSCLVDTLEKDSYEQALRDLKRSLDQFIG